MLQRSISGVNRQRSIAYTNSSTRDDDDDNNDPVAHGSSRGMMTRAYSRKVISTPEEPDRDKLVKTFISEGLQLVVKAAAGQLEDKQHSLHRPAFELFCQAHVKAYAEYKQFLLNKQLEQLEKVSDSGDSEHPPGVVTDDDNVQPATPLPGEKQPVVSPLPGAISTSDSVFVTNPNPNNTTTIQDSITMDPPHIATTTTTTTTGIDPSTTTTTSTIVQPPTTTTSTVASSSKVDLPYFKAAFSAFNLSTQYYKNNYKSPSTR